MRKYGLTVDQLLSADVVTADGEFLTASTDENADLFWGICGAGANFGVVTEFEFRLNPLGPIVVAGPIFWPMEKSPEVMRFYRDWIAAAPDELMTIVVHRKAPPLPFVPAEFHGKPVVAVIPCYAGPIEEGEAAVRPMKEFSSPILDLCVPKPFVEHQAMFDPTFPHYRWYYIKPCGVPELTDEIIDITVEHSLRISSPLTAFPIWQMGGAVASRGDDENAFGGRDVGFTYNIGGCTDDADGFADERDWVREFYAALAPYQTGAYINFLDAAGNEAVVESYGAEKYARLRELKRRYDPDNFFHVNQNIPPA
jgi:FAD/FMN-containing dehydrogenase